MVLSGAPGETVTLNLQNLIWRDQSMLTLEGTATTSFVINVTKQFSLSGSSKIILSGGLDCSSVFFNVLGHGRALSLTNEAFLHGTLTASQRIVRLGGHSIVEGQVFAKKIKLGRDAQIIPCVSP